MKPFNKLVSRAVPLRVDNVDTDQIIPAAYLTTVTRKGLGEGLFHAWRYDHQGNPDPNFKLNWDQYEGARVLIGGANFGSGSSREHAVWALTDYGFQAVVASSFADIFFNNSLKNGLLPVQLKPEQVEELMFLAEDDPAATLEIDLNRQRVKSSKGHEFFFSIDPFRKSCLLQGLDDLGYLLQRVPKIEQFEEARAC